MKVENGKGYEVKWINVFKKYQALNQIRIDTIKHAKYKSPNEIKFEQELKEAIKEALEHHPEAEVIFDGHSLKNQPEAGCSCSIL